MSTAVILPIAHATKPRRLLNLKVCVLFVFCFSMFSVVVVVLFSHRVILAFWQKGKLYSLYRGRLKDACKELIKASFGIAVHSCLPSCPDIFKTGL